MNKSKMNREVDLVKTSMNVEDLNKLIIFLRYTSKLCKIQVIQKITRKISIYKNKCGTKKQVEQNLNRCQKLLEEIQILKATHVDNITKFALNSSLNLQVLSKPELTIKERAFTRVACHKPFKTFIENWRHQHSDWSSLAAFVQTHISRRYKKNKKHLKAKLPLFINKDNLERNVIKVSVKNDSDLKDIDKSDELQISNKLLESITDDKLNINEQNENYDIPDESSGNSIEYISDNNISTDLIYNKEIDINKTLPLKNDAKKDKKSVEKLSQNNKPNVDSYRGLLLGSNESIKKDKSKDQQDLNPVDYRDGNVLVKQFHLNSLNEEEELEFGTINNQLKEEEKIAVTQDNFFLRDGEDENNAVDKDDILLLANEDISDFANDRDETEYRGKYPNRFNQKRFNGDDRKYLGKRDELNMHSKNNKWNKEKNFVKTDLYTINRSFKKSAPSKNYVIKDNKFGGAEKNKNKSNLHPSWEASKKKKAQQSIAKFQGKKIIFDD